MLHVLNCFSLHICRNSRITTSDPKSANARFVRDDDLYVTTADTVKVTKEDSDVQCDHPNDRFSGTQTHNEAEVVNQQCHAAIHSGEEKVEEHEVVELSTGDTAPDVDRSCAFTFAI